MKGTMEEPKTSPGLASGLVKFQEKVPAIEKNREAKIQMKNGGTYTYKYADLADIWSAIRQPLADAGLAVTQLLEGGGDGHTSLRTIIWHESGENLESVLDIPTQDRTPQEAGSLFTYYKRYALSAALGISTEEDDDATSSNEKPTAEIRASTSKPPSDSQIGLIRKLAKEQGTPDEGIEARLKQITTSAEASEAIKKLKGEL